MIVPQNTCWVCGDTVENHTQEKIQHCLHILEYRKQNELKKTDMVLAVMREAGEEE